MRPVLFSGVMPFLCELSPRAAWKEMNWPVKVLARRRACSPQNPGGPRQPLDRQFRYYSEGERLASGVCGGRIPRTTDLERDWGTGRMINGPNAGKPLRMEWLSIPAIVTGLPVEGGLRCLTAPYQAFPAGSPFSGPLIGGCSCLGPAVLTADLRFPRSATTSLALI
jgi:hypothetical protein